MLVPAGYRRALEERDGQAFELLFLAARELLQLLRELVNLALRAFGRRPLIGLVLVRHAIQLELEEVGKILGDRSGAAATSAGGRWVSVLVEAPDPAARFAARPVDAPYLEAVHRLVADAPADHLASYAGRLAVLPHDLVLATEDGEVDAAYEQLFAVLTID